jgi:hypothetical protein
MRRSFLALAALCLAACRCGVMAPGLGYGVEGAEDPGPRSEAEAMASLARIAFDGRVETVPVIAVRSGSAYLLLPDLVGTRELEKLEATFTAKDGAATTVTGAKVVAERREDGWATLLAVPTGTLPLRPSAIAAPRVARNAANLRLVRLREKDGPLVRDLTPSGEIDSGASRFAGRSPPAQVPGRAGVIFDSSTWHVVGVAREGGGSSGSVEGFGAAWLASRFAGTPRRVRIETTADGDGCAVTARVELEDPAGTVREVALLLGDPGAAFAIPEPAKVRKNERADAESPVLPIAKKLADRKAVAASGPTELSARAKRCGEERFGQLLLVGEYERWLSWPFRLPAPGKAVAVPSGRDGWRVDDLPAAKPLEWKGIAAAAPPPATPELGCRPPVDRLDPDVAWLVGKPFFADKTCADGLLVFPAGEEERARCVQGSPLSGIAADGAAVYFAAERLHLATVWRRAVPDRNAKDATGTCRLSAPLANDDLLAANPCGASNVAGAYFGPGSELVFGCASNLYRRLDGTALDLHGAALLRLGEGGHALVRLPWWSLGVLGPDGTGREVGGLPLGARIDRSVPTAAVADGFLVAFSVGPEWRKAELWHVTFDGRATPRGRFELGDADGGLDRRLGADGGLYTLFGNVSAARPIQRYAVDGTVRSVYDPRQVLPERRFESLSLLLGWRSAGPVTAGPPSFEPGGSNNPVERAAKAYVLSDPAATPCSAGLQTLDPARIWLAFEGRAVDPSDGARFAWLTGTADVLAGDGRLVRDETRSVGGPNLGIRGVFPRPPPGEALRPTDDGQSCRLYDGLGPKLLPDPVATCGHEVMAAWAPTPGGATVAVQCSRPGSSATFVGERALGPGALLRHVGARGELLVQQHPSNEWSLVGSDGRQVALAKLPREEARAIRAVDGGFAVVVRPEGSRKRNALELLQVGRDGRVRRLGGFDGLPEDRTLGQVALTPDLALHALVGDNPSQTTLYRIAAGGAPRPEWTGKVYVTMVRLLTGP